MSLKKKYEGKIGYCDNKDLGISKPGGHYVYIQRFKGDKCDVNVVTSLENLKRDFSKSKIKHVKKGNTYPIPYYDANFTLWSGINKDVIKDVDVSKIKDIGKKNIKRRHKIFLKFFGK